METFSAPVVVRVKPPKGAEKVERIPDVTAGLAALRDGLGGFAMDLPEWHFAHQRLARAKLRPTPEAIEAARLALRDLAKRTGVLLD